MIVQKEYKVGSSGEFFGVFGEDSEFSFVGSDAEAPRVEPLGDVID
jgi:hypothetical protein